MRAHCVTINLLVLNESHQCLLFQTNPMYLHMIINITRYETSDITKTRKSLIIKITTMDLYLYINILRRNGSRLIGALEYKYGSLSFLRYNQIACQRTLLHTTAKA